MAVSPGFAISTVLTGQSAPQTSWSGAGAAGGDLRNQSSPGNLYLPGYHFFPVLVFSNLTRSLIDMCFVCLFVCLFVLPGKSDFLFLKYCEGRGGGKWSPDDGGPWSKNMERFTNLHVILVQGPC